MESAWKSAAFVSTSGLPMLFTGASTLPDEGTKLSPTPFFVLTSTLSVFPVGSLAGWLAGWVAGWLAGWLVAETSNFSTRRLEIDGSYEARCACFRKISLRSPLTSSFSVLLPSQSMKMAIYYEILRNLRSIRTASKHRDVAISSNPRRRLKNSPKIISRSRSIIRIITP